MTALLSPLNLTAQEADALALIGQEVASPRDTEEHPVLTPILKTIASTAIPVEVEGVIESLVVREGDPIAKDQHLGNLKDSKARSVLHQLQAKVDLARKKSSNDLGLRLAANSHAVAKNEYDRALRANERVPNTYPRNEIDRLRLVSDQTELEIQQAQHEMELAQLELAIAEAELLQASDQLRRHVLTSPIDGLVLSLSKNTGEWAHLGEEVLRVVQLNRLRIEGFLPAEIASFQMKGAEAKLRIRSTGEVFKGKVVFISPELNPVDGNVRIFIDVDNSAQKLRPGLKLDATIIVSNQPQHP